MLGYIVQTMEKNLFEEENSLHKKEEDEKIENKMLFVIMTIFIMIILTMLIVPLSKWMPAGIAALISTILFSVYLLFFDILNERKRWIKF